MLLFFLQSKKKRGSEIRWVSRRREKLTCRVGSSALGEHAVLFLVDLGIKGVGRISGSKCSFTQLDLNCQSAASSLQWFHDQTSCFKMNGNSFFCHMSRFVLRKFEEPTLAVVFLHNIQKSCVNELHLFCSCGFLYTLQPVSYYSVLQFIQQNCGQCDGDIKSDVFMTGWFHSDPH